MDNTFAKNLHESLTRTWYPSWYAVLIQDCIEIRYGSIDFIIHLHICDSHCTHTNVVTPEIFANKFMDDLISVLQVDNIVKKLHIEGHLCNSSSNMGLPVSIIKKLMSIFDVNRTITSLRLSLIGTEYVRDLANLFTTGVVDTDLGSHVPLRVERQDANVPSH